MFLSDDIPDLRIERTTGNEILLQQYDPEQNVRLIIHPIHIRYIAEQFGLVETSDPTAAKTIATLQRRMGLLRDRIDQLAGLLIAQGGADAAHAEAAKVLAKEFCDDIEQVGHVLQNQAG